MVYRLIRADGHYRWITDRAAPYHDARGTFLGYIGSALDITDRIDLEAKLEQQSQHKSRLMAALSHDARTPLNAVVLSAKLLESQAKDQDDPEVQECLTTIQNSVKNVLDLLSDLLDLSRIDAGATLAETSRFELRATLAECLSSIEPQARAKGLDVRLEAGPLDGARLDTDRAKLKQILSNLLSNSLRYTESGHIRLFAEQRRGVDPDRGGGHRDRDQGRADQGRRSSTSSPSWSTPTGPGPRGPAWDWRSAGGSPTCSTARSTSTASPAGAAPSSSTCPPCRPHPRGRPGRAGRPRARPRLRRRDPDRRRPRRQPEDPRQGPPEDGLPRPGGRRRDGGPPARPPGAADGRS